ncbi:MAG: alpha/beta hydrolase [Ignavibacteriaceae bacterium]|nr:hypothetical protein [Ignavibacteriaceae bacterium]NUM72108.1 alpha/beta hydrolase [Ignavibacteriaceae bacterium]
MFSPRPPSFTNKCIAVSSLAFVIFTTAVIHANAAGTEPSADSLPRVTSGRIERIFVQSQFIDSRSADVWLPEDYSPQKKYAVLYMHDGLMLFDTASAWNGLEWRVDETAAELIKSGEIRDLIVVAIPNNGKKRRTEFFPEKVLTAIPEPEQSRLRELFTGEPLADEYLKFIVKELKPLIDARWSTLTDRENTFICGSSSGGLITLYAICEYPEIFGAAACLSTHWTGMLSYNEAIPAALTGYLKENLPDPKTHRLYFDHGNKTLDENYPRFQRLADLVFINAGYGTGNFLSLQFDGDDHSERAWARRFPIALKFIAGNRLRQ